jgi:hypothetical protein
MAPLSIDDLRAARSVTKLTGLIRKYLQAEKSIPAMFRMISKTISQNLLARAVSPQTAAASARHW